MFKPSAIIHAAAAVHYKTSILNPDGSVAKTRGFKKNLILDQGLDFVAANLWCNCFNYCAVGTGITSTRRAGGPVNFSRAGTTITASAGFFTAADVGRLLKWNTGEEVYISAYTSPTQVSSVSSGTIASGPGTVWYVNQTALDTEYARTNVVTAGGGDNGTSFSIDTYTHQRTFLFPAVGAGVTFNEIGWSPSAGAGQLFGRDVIPGGDTLAAGQQYKVVVKLIITISPVTPQAQANVGNNGFSTAGQFTHEYILGAYSEVAASGATQYAGALEPAAAITVNIVQDPLVLLTNASYTSQTTSDFGRVALASQAYTNGNFFRDCIGTVAVTDGNSTTLRAISFGQGLGGVVARAFTVRMTTLQTKDSNHTVKITLRKSWGRVLVN